MLYECPTSFYSGSKCPSLSLVGGGGGGREKMSNNAISHGRANVREALGSSLARVICETNQVQHVGGQVVLSRGSPVFAPPYD